MPKDPKGNLLNLVFQNKFPHIFWPLLKCGFSVVFRIRHGARSRQEHIVFLMRLNKYLFNRVNNKERERGQRSVVWFKRGQPCLHRLHVLSTVFSWRPFSSFSLWIIFLPPIPPRRPPPPCHGGGGGGEGWDCLGAGCAKGGSPWTSRAPTSTLRRSC